LYIDTKHINLIIFFIILSCHQISNAVVIFLQALIGGCPTVRGLADGLTMVSLKLAYWSF
jgi:hypothetical protein